MRVQRCRHPRWGHPVRRWIISCMILTDRAERCPIYRVLVFYISLNSLLWSDSEEIRWKRILRVSRTFLNSSGLSETSRKLNFEKKNIQQVKTTHEKFSVWTLSVGTLSV